MAFEVTPEWLAGLGVQGLGDDQVRHALVTVYERVEYSVGERISAAMSDEQVQEFSELLQKPEPERRQSALAWLETNFPSYKDVVREEFAVIEAMITDDPAGFAQAVRLSASEVRA